MFDCIGMEHSIASQDVWQELCACWEFWLIGLTTVILALGTGHEKC